VIRDNIGNVEPRIASAASPRATIRWYWGPGATRVWSSWARRNSCAARKPTAIETVAVRDERYDGFQRDDPPQHRDGDAGQPQDAERTLALSESRRDSDGKAAAGDRPADEDHDVGQLLIPGEEAIGVRAHERERVGRKPTRKAFSSCDRAVSTAAVDPFVPTTRTCSGNAASASGVIGAGGHTV
jgi:hypothetical protein